MVYSNSISRISLLRSRWPQHILGTSKNTSSAANIDSKNSRNHSRCGTTRFERCGVLPSPIFLPLCIEKKTNPKHTNRKRTTSPSIHRDPPPPVQLFIRARNVFFSLLLSYCPNRPSWDIRTFLYVWRKGQTQTDPTPLDTAHGTLERSLSDTLSHGANAAGAN